MLEHRTDGYYLDGIGPLTFREAEDLLDARENRDRPPEERNVGEAVDGKLA